MPSGSEGEEGVERHPILAQNPTGAKAQKSAALLTWAPGSLSGCGPDWLPLPPPARP